MSTEEALKAIARPWGEVPDHEEAKAIFSDVARQATVSIPLDAPYVQYPEGDEINRHPLVVGFNDLKMKNGDASHAASRDGKLYKKHLNIFGRGLPRDRCFELRNLHIMNSDVHSFIVVQNAMRKILFENAEQDEEQLAHAAAKILEELQETRERYLRYNADNSQREVDELAWFLDGVYERFEPMIELGGDQANALVQFKALLQEAYDKVYYITPRILTLKFFSLEKKIVDGSSRWNLVLVTDCLGLSLDTFLIQYRGRRGNVFLKKHALDILIQMTECLAFLHENHYLHGDLKDDNYFVIAPDPNNLDNIQVYLGDLGQSRLGDVTRTNYGYPPFKAPEFANGRTKWTDIYALGMTFLQVISPNEMTRWTNRFFGSAINFPNVEGGERPNILNMDQALHDLITECLANDPHSRPSVFKVLTRLKIIRANIDPAALVPSEDRAGPVLAGEYYPPASSLPEAMGGLRVAEAPESNYTNQFP